MTPIEYADKLRLQLLKLQEENTPLLLGATTVTAEMHERIFDRGEAAGSGSIGQYNDKRILYLNPNDPNVYGRSKIGKPGKFKNGKDRKTVKTTYKGYKSLLGKPAGGAFKNLELTGDLQSNFVNRVVPKERSGSAPVSDKNVLKLNVNEYAIALSDENLEKAMGAEEQSGRPIFKLSFGEELLFREVVEFELKRMFS